MAWEVEEMVGAERDCSGVVSEEPFRHVRQSWHCSQVEKEPDERCDGLAHG